jgi:hypothetical protein
MNAFHCLWTAPFYARHGKAEEFCLDDFDVLTTILSALKWRELNGSIKLYTDEAGAEYVSRLGLSGLWDRGIDTDALAEANCDRINPRAFWAAGKLLALQQERAPCVMVDTDFIAWRYLDEIADQPDLAVIHREPLYNGVYLTSHDLKTAEDYKFDPEWSWDEWACNSALVFFGNDELRRYYVAEALRFMDGNTEEAKEAVSQMVFAEQRLLGMCAAAKGTEIGELMPYDPEAWQRQDSFTHVWGYKDERRTDDAKREEFCHRCVRRIAQDYPYLVPVLASAPDLGYYFGRAGASRASSSYPSEVLYRQRFPYGGYGPLP